MFTAMEMIPFGSRWLERNIRLGGFSTQTSAENAVIKKGTGFVVKDTHEVVSVVIKGKLYIVEKSK